MSNPGYLNGAAAWDVIGDVAVPGAAQPTHPRPAFRTPARPRVDWDVVTELRARVATRLEADRARLGSAEWSDADERALAASLVGQELERWALSRVTAGLSAPDRQTERALAGAVTAALFGLGRLQPLLEREDVENVHVHGADRVVLELADGRLEAAAPVAGSDAELVEMLTGWAARAGQTGREFSPAHPLLNLRLPTGGPLGSRLAAVMEVTGRPTIAIPGTASPGSPWTTCSPS
ncbi:MAG TPA: hypothetical protein VEL73_06415, partial [Mycobacteriales bacterium]|nr:hypothetical protein [Mycobacteriales bacterium]